MVTTYRDCTVGGFAELVAARQPAPGGGPVAAVTVSLSAALVAMAARYSTEVAPGLGLVERAERLSSRAAGLADEDAAAYQAVIEANASSQNADPAHRRERIASTMQRAAEVALQVAQLGAETATLATQLAVEGNRSTRGDAVAAVLLAEAATRAAAHLVAIDVDAGGCDEKLVVEAERSVEIARTASSQLPAASSPSAGNG